MSGFEVNNTLPKLGHVTDLREQWLVRADGALAHRLQDREISSHLCENRYRNQQIREDFPVAMNEQKDLENEARIRELAVYRQAEIDAKIARDMAEINLRRKSSQNSSETSQQCSSSRLLQAMPIPYSLPKSEPVTFISSDINPDELGLSPVELEEIRRRLIQEERDLRLARELSHESKDHDALLADMRYAVEAQDGELARLLQEREYKKLQRAKEKARQKALQKKQLRLATQQLRELQEPLAPQATLCDAYSNPRDVLHQNGLRLSKSVDSDLNYVEPFEKEYIQSKASAVQDKKSSEQYYNEALEAGPSNSKINIGHCHSTSYESGSQHAQEYIGQSSSLQHRQPPPPPTSGKKPRFPDPVSIRPASHYPMDSPVTSEYSPNLAQVQHSYSHNNNLYDSSFPAESSCSTTIPEGQDRHNSSKRLSVMSEITVEGLEKRRNKKDMHKKKKGCKIQ